MPSTTLCKSCETVLVEDFTLPLSPIPLLLGTNAAPSSSQIIAIRNTLAQIDSYAIRLDQGVDRVQEVLNELLRERQKVRQYVEEHEAFLSLSRRFPDEVWSEIFLHTLPGRALLDIRKKAISYKYHIGESPILLGRVCSPWRNIAISTPALWSDISVTIRSRGAESQAKCVQQWLERSRGYPLSLRVFRAYEDQNIDWANHPTVKVLVPSSPQWSTLHLYLTSPNQGSEALGAIKGNLHSLRDLAVSISSLSAIGDTPLDIFSEAPLLRAVTFGFRCTIPILQLPYGQVTHFHASRCDLLDILRRSPNLIEISGSGHRRTSQLPSFEHPRLRILHLEKDGSLLDKLKLPALDHLSVHGWKTWPHAEFRSFLTRSSCVLRCLSLTSVLIPPETLIGCLLEIPLLLKLHLLHVHVTPIVLTRMKDCPQLVPKLQAIELSSCDPLYGQHLVHFIRSRWVPPSMSLNHCELADYCHLQSATFSISPYRHDLGVTNALDELRSEVDSLSADGFRISGSLKIDPNGD